MIFYVLIILCLCLILMCGMLAYAWRNSRAQLQHAQNMLAMQRQDPAETMAGGIAHDFNNILGSVLGFSLLLEEDLAALPEQKDMATQIVTAARRGQEIVAQLMQYSRKAMTRESGQIDKKTDKRKAS